MNYKNQNLYFFKELFIEMHYPMSDFWGISMEANLYLDTMINLMQNYLYIDRNDLKKEIGYFCNQRKDEYYYKDITLRPEDINQFFNYYSLFTKNAFGIFNDEILIIDRFKLVEFRNYMIFKDLISEEVYNFSIEFIQSLYHNQLTISGFKKCYAKYHRQTLNAISKFRTRVDSPLNDFLLETANNLCVFIDNYYDSSIDILSSTRDPYLSETTDDQDLSNLDLTVE